MVTKKDKMLLLKDLCMRLPYGVKCYPIIINGEPNTIGGYCEILDAFYIREISGWFNISMIKPYLHPLSSLTSEDKAELNAITEEFGDNWFEATTPEERWKYCFLNSSNEIDWLISHHFDFHNLIERGLAIDCTGLNIY